MGLDVWTDFFDETLPTRFPSSRSSKAGKAPGQDGRQLHGRVWRERTGHSQLRVGDLSQKASWRREHLRRAFRDE